MKTARPRPRAALLALALASGLTAALTACASDEPVQGAAAEPPPQEDRCRETTLPGSWKSLQSGNLWVFQPDGKLRCEGDCRFTQVTGDPVSWAYEPSANIWSRPIEHLKLTFTKITFDGVFGSFRCRIEDSGKTLRLISEDEGSMVFERQ